MTSSDNKIIIASSVPDVKISGAEFQARLLAVSKGISDILAGHNLPDGEYKDDSPYRLIYEIFGWMSAAIYKKHIELSHRRDDGLVELQLYDAERKLKRLYEVLAITTDSAPAPASFLPPLC